MYTYVIYVKHTVLCELQDSVNSFMRGFQFDEKILIGEDTPAFTYQCDRMLTDEEKQKLMIKNEGITVTRIELLDK